MTLQYLQRLIPFKLEFNVPDGRITVDQEEECSSFICDSASNQSFSSSGGSVQKNTTGRLNHGIN